MDLPVTVASQYWIEIHTHSHFDIEDFLKLLFNFFILALDCFFQGVNSLSLLFITAEEYIESILL